jgi:hypothetical protein
MYESRLQCGFFSRAKFRLSKISPSNINLLNEYCDNISNTCLGLDTGEPRCMSEIITVFTSFSETVLSGFINTPY